MAVEVPGVMLVELFLQFGLFGDKGVEVCIGFGEFGVDLIIARKHFHNGSHGLPHDFDNGFRFIEFWFLLKQTDSVALAHGDFTDVVLVDARDDAQQRRLASAVQTQHTDLGAVIEAEGNIAQDLFIGRDDLPNLIHGVNYKGFV